MDSRSYRNQMSRVFFNTNLRDESYAPGTSRKAFSFHRSLDGYAPSPLRSVKALALKLGVGEILVKNESDRFGLPAFKILGASWAAFSLLAERLGLDPSSTTIQQLREEGAETHRIELVTASTGNHGRAVARAASMMNCAARRLG